MYLCIMIKENIKEIIPLINYLKMEILFEDDDRITFSKDGLNCQIHAYYVWDKFISGMILKDGKLTSFHHDNFLDVIIETYHEELIGYFRKKK